MPIGKQTKRSRTGFVGEFYIYSELLRNEKNCFITLGNAKSVDLILVDKRRRAYYIDVKSTSSLMGNTHKHPKYNPQIGKLGRWQLTAGQFWQTHPKNPKRVKGDFPEFYIFHNINDHSRNYVVTGKELEKIYHKRISAYLKKHNVKTLHPKHHGVWEICEYCFDRKALNAWDRLP